jgi:acetoin utilization deacetylase AcuC-like enzyme
MDQVPVVASKAHLAHDPAYELNAGRVVSPVWERPARGEALRTALATAGHRVVEPLPHGLGPVEAVHDRGLLAFLEAAWPAWKAAGGPDVLIPDTFVTARFAGAGARRTLAPLGAPGAWCFDTATPMVAGTWGAALAAVDLALTAADLVAGGAWSAYALCRPPGHHAGPDYYGGFCFLNNAAVAARSLQRRLGRVAVLDVDFHHGNGTQDIFYTDPAVLYVSVHADPDRHYPFFTGGVGETGAGPGTGATRNFPIPDDTEDSAYLTVLEVACDVVERFDPAVVVVSLGFDAYAGDPVGGMALTREAYAGIGRLVAELARPVVWVQEGGYALDAIGELAVATLDAFQAGRSG